jgi:hypothetical protein
MTQQPRPYRDAIGIAPRGTQTGPRRNVGGTLPRQDPDTAETVQSHALLPIQALRGPRRRTTHECGSRSSGAPSWGARSPAVRSSGASWRVRSELASSKPVGGPPARTTTREAERLQRFDNPDDTPTAPRRNGAATDTATQTGPGRNDAATPTPPRPDPDGLQRKVRMTPTASRRQANGIRSLTTPAPETGGGPADECPPSRTGWGLMQPEEQQPKARCRRSGAPTPTGPRRKQRANPDPTPPQPRQDRDGAFTRSSPRRRRGRPWTRLPGSR